MDNREGDRHRHRTRIWESGASKRRKAKEATMKSAEEMAKIRKLDQFFTVQSRQVSERSDDFAEPDQPDNASVEMVVDPGKEKAEVVTGPIEEHIEKEADSGTSYVEAEVEGPPGGNDIGLWPSIISEQMRDYWLKRGVSTIQHCDESLFIAHSVQQPRKDRNIPRMCTLGLFRRQNHNGEVITRNWLCFSPSNGRVYCFTCRLMCLTTAPESSQLSSNGFCDWKHSQERIQSHEQSTDHLKATIAFNRRLKAIGRIDTELTQQVERLEHYWRSVLKRVVNVIQFIAERGLAFRGDNELVGSPRNGNFLGILELIAQYDDFLAQHIETQANRGKGHTNYLSSTIMEELISVMGEQVLGEIISRVKKSKYYSISLDSTPDAAHIDQLTLVLRYMEKDGPVERFVTFMANKGHGAQDMFNALVEFLKRHDLDLGNCRGQSYDNASAMSGKYNGLQAKVREKNNLASWIPCTAHSLNLVAKNAVESCSTVHFFDFLEKLFVFFTVSTHRHQLLTEALKNNDSALTLKHVTTTRWSCRADATKALKHDYQQIKDVLKQIADDFEEKGCVRCEAEGLLTQINQLEIGIYTTFWNDILQRTDATSKNLQHAKLDLNTAVASLTSLKNYVASKRDSFETYEKQGEELSGSTEYVQTQTKTRHKRRNVRLNPLDYGHTEEVQLSPSEKYRTETFLPVIDQFIASLDQRLQAYKDISSQFSFFSHLKELSSDELKAAAEQLVRSYSDDLDITFIDELCQFVTFANIFTDEEPKDISTELFMYKLIMKKGVQDTFPNIEIALRIYLILMVTNCSGERSFSKLKLIENRLRTSMKQERLVNLVIMSIESDILRELDFSDIISDFAARKSRKVPGL